MTEYWIKLYIEILDDPKMATLPDRLWRRVIELFLCAGRLHKNGELPDTKQLAWLMRIPTDELDLDLKQIATTGIVEQTKDGWTVTKFAKRQAASSGAERVKAYRERVHREQYYGNERVTNSYIDTETDTDTDQNTTSAPAAAIPYIPPKQEPPQKHYQESDILKLIAAASGMVAIPPKEMGRVEQVYRLLESYGWDACLSALKDQYHKWVTTPRKNGTGNYSGVNFGWVDWAQDYLAGNRPVQKSTAEMTDDEYKAWLLGKEQEATA